MSLLLRATALCVLIVGCGGGDRQRVAEPTRPHAAARTATATSAQPAAATAPATTTATATATVPMTTAAAQAPAVPSPAGGPWKDCGRIRSPVDRRAQRVEARVFDCRAARRVAVRYLRNGSLPRGWRPTDCAASRAACEQGGWGFRVVKN